MNQYHPRYCRQIISLLFIVALIYRCSVFTNLGFSLWHIFGVALPVKKAANYIFSLRLYGEILNYLVAAVLIVVPVMKGTQAKNAALGVSDQRW